MVTNLTACRLAMVGELQVASSTLVFTLCDAARTTLQLALCSKSTIRRITFDCASAFRAPTTTVDRTSYECAIPANGTAGYEVQYKHSTTSLWHTLLTVPQPGKLTEFSFSPVLAQYWRVVNTHGVGVSLSTMQFHSGSLSAISIPPPAAPAVIETRQDKPGKPTGEAINGSSISLSWYSPEALLIQRFEFYPNTSAFSDRCVAWLNEWCRTHTPYPFARYDVGWSQLSARTTPARTTPSRTTPDRTTPDRTTPAQSQADQEERQWRCYSTGSLQQPQNLVVDTATRPKSSRLVSEGQTGCNPNQMPGVPEVNPTCWNFWTRQQELEQELDLCKQTSLSSSGSTTWPPIQYPLVVDGYRVWARSTVSPTWAVAIESLSTNHWTVTNLAPGASISTL